MNKKKTVVILTALITALTLTTLIASAIVLTLYTGSDADEYYGRDLAADATEITASSNGALTGLVTDGNVNTFWQGERRGSYIQFYYADGVEFNTIVIDETGMSISAFEIYVSDDGRRFDKVYEQDRIQRGRLCAMTEQIDTKYVTVRIVDSEASPRIGEISIYNAKNSGEDFTLSARADISRMLYKINEWENEGITPGTEQLYELFDGAKYGMFDEIIIEAGVVWTSDGQLSVNNDALAGAFNTYNLSTALGYLNQVNSQARFILSLSAADGALGNTDYGKVADNLNTFLSDNCFVGIEIDCISAESKSENSSYANAIKALSDALGEDAYICAALKTEQLKYFSNVSDKIDRLNLAGFCELDQNGDSAAFYSSCIQALEICLDNGFDEKQINLGAPLYGTYSEDAGEKYAFSSVAGEYGWFDNVFECAWGEESVSDIRFNGMQLLYDKTSYAIYRGLGGITLFGLECDREGSGEDTLSYAVLKAISDAEGRR